MVLSSCGGSWIFHCQQVIDQVVMQGQRVVDPDYFSTMKIGFFPVVKHALKPSWISANDSGHRTACERFVPQMNHGDTVGQAFVGNSFKSDAFENLL